MSEATSASDRFLEAAGEILTRDQVVRPGDDQLKDYADPFAFTDEYATPPAGAVRPGSVEEVQALVRLANETGASLWVVSRGRNLGYGGSTPRDRASVVLDLGRMNRVRHVDSELCYAVVEPGVSFFDLHEHLRRQDAPLWTSVPDLGWGSLIGNALERGFGYTAYGQHSNFLCGLEVVLPDGELIRTGMASIDGASTAHLYKGGYGPSVDGLFSQSNLGIVVSAGIWLMPRPEAVASCVMHVPTADRLGDIVDTVRPLMLNGTIDSVAIVGNALAVASGVMPRAAIAAGPEPLGDEAISAVAQKFGLGFWNSKFAVYGPQEVVDAKVALIRAAAERIGAGFDVHTYPGDVPPNHVHPGDRSQLGIPSGDLIQMAAWRGGSPAHTDFSLVAPNTGADAQRLVDLVRRIVEEAGLDHVGGFTMFGRHAVMLSLLSYDGSSPAEQHLVEELFARLLAESAAAGFVPYRAHPHFMDDIADLYDTDGSGTRQLVRRIKRALDPGDVLSPGKQGIRAG